MTPLLSYAQNAEDVVLARALGETEAGFYVDVGAASPYEASVTRHFYEAGWSGINIEPLPEWAAELRQVRPRDTTLELAVADRAGERRLFRVIEDPALSTLDTTLAEGYRARGLGVEELSIRIATLDEVLAEAKPARIDFLKIDVEGAEDSVLAGLDLTRWRPRVIVVESTKPMTVEPTFGAFEARLIAGRYVFAATDGINRYYARAEEAESLVPLLVPANSTDDFVPLREQLLAEEVSRLRVYVRHLERDLEIVREAIETAPAADHSRHEPSARSSRAGASRTISLERLAICTTPQTGAGRLAAALSDALNAPAVTADHPADVDFSRIEDRCVLELCWGRTEQFRTRLASNGFRVVTVVRHPFESLLAYLRLAQVDRSTSHFLDGAGGRDDELWHRGPTSSSFLDWAVGERARALLEVSASWARDPGALRVSFDALVAEPHAAIGEILELGGFEPVTMAAVPTDRQPVDLEAIEGGWRRYLSSDAAERLASSLGHVFGALGVAEDTDPTGLPDAELAEKNWAQLLHALGDHDAP